MLVDTNVVMEAVRTRCWNAVSGGLRVETVAECRDELRRGDRGQPGSLPVNEQDLARIRVVHAVTSLERATFAMGCGLARGMDPGERDLFALRTPAPRDSVWIVCSADKACVSAAVSLGWHERMHSLGALAAVVGATPNPPLGRQFGEAWLSEVRTRYLLGA